MGSAPRELWEKEQNRLQGRGSRIYAPLPTSVGKGLSLGPHTPAARGSPQAVAVGVTSQVGTDSTWYRSYPRVVFCSSLFFTLPTLSLSQISDPKIQA